MPAIGVFGVGRIGTALCAGLARAGLPLVGLAGRKKERAEKLAAALTRSYGCKGRSVEIGELTMVADIVFLAMPDESIAEVLSALAWQEGKITVHLSGAATLNLLSQAAEAGASIASFHPLNTFPTVSWDDAGLSFAADTLANSYVAVAAGDAVAEQTLIKLAPMISRGFFAVPETKREIYHAAAVFASNFVTGLFGASLSLWQTLGYTEREALSLMAPLVSSACANTLRFGPVQALTGPAARGDVGTITKHLEALARLPSDQANNAALYRALTLSLLPLAHEAGTLSRMDEEQIRQLLIKEYRQCEK